MKNLIIASSIALALLFGSVPKANAVQTSATVTIAQLVVYQDGNFDVQFSGNICNDTGAAMNWGQARPQYGATSDGIKAMLATVTAAKLAGRNVVVRTSGFDWGCKLTAVQLMQ